MDTTEMERIAEKAGRLVESLIMDNRAQIKETWAESESDEPSISVSFTVKMSGATTSPKVDVKMGFSKKFTDEVSEQLDDIKQAPLPFDDEP